MTRQTALEIEAEATRWLMRLDHEDSLATRVELSAWLEQDRRNRGAWLQARAAAFLIAHSINPVGSANGFPVNAVHEPPPMTRRLALAGACVGVIAAVVGGGFYLALSARAYRTTTGEIRRIPLADGSLAMVNTDSALQVDFERNMRTVRLDRGEVWFRVAHDATRPFVVQSGLVRVQATGTAFCVRREGNHAIVDVSEGTVEIWTVGHEDHRRPAVAGDRAVVANAAAAPPIIAATDVSRNLLWREGKIDLAGRTLEQATDELNRYNERKLIIIDPALSRERFYGVFNVDDPAQFAIAVHDSMRVPVHVSERGDIRIGAGAD